MDLEKEAGHPSTIHQFTYDMKLIGGEIVWEGVEIVEMFWEYSILEIYNLVNTRDFLAPLIQYRFDSTTLSGRGAHAHFPNSGW